MLLDILKEAARSFFKPKAQPPPNKNKADASRGIFAHFPPASQWQESPIPQVPCLVLDDYDGEEFLSYPDRRGVSNVQAVIRGPENPDRRSIVSRAAFLQTWLFFGTLSTCFGVPVKTSDFTYIGPDGSPLITTAALPGYLEQWHSRIADSSETEKKLLEDKMNTCINVAVEIVADSSDESGVQNSPSNFLMPEIALSINVLAVTLTSAATTLFGFRVSFRNPTSQLLRRRMQEKEWCPHTIAQLDLAQLCVAIQMRPSWNTKGGKHNRCSKLICQETSITERYRPAHTTEGCNCEIVWAHPQDVKNCIQRGHLPLVSVVAGPGQKPQIKIVEGKASTSYTAFSHVWSHGLGCPAGNGIFQCQLLRLNQLAAACSVQTQTQPEAEMSNSNLAYLSTANAPSKGICPPEISLFWLDTLCVPRERCEEKVSAIRNMYSTYASAARVLVLDTGLEHQHANVPVFELMNRILTSDWAHRLWTLQEGYLNDNLYFLIKEFFVDVRALESYSIEDKFRAFPVWMSTIAKFAILRGGLQLSGCQSLIRIWNALQWRSTSLQEDETLCLATLIGLDPKALLEVPSSERYKTLFAMSNEWPEKMIFLPGKKLADPGFRWAPSSFTGRFALSNHHSDDKTAKRTSEGLLVSLPSIHIYNFTRAYDTEPPQPLSIVVADVANHAIYELELTQKVGVYGDLFPNASSTVEEETVVVPFDGLDLALLLPNKLAPNEISAAVLCSGLQVHDRGASRARYLARLSVTRGSDSRADFILGYVEQNASSSDGGTFSLWMLEDEPWRIHVIVPGSLLPHDTEYLLS